MEVVLNEVPPFVHLGINFQRFLSLGPLRDNDLCAALVHIVDDPIAIEGLVGEQRIEPYAPDQRRDANRVTPVGGHQYEAHQVAEGIHQSQNLGGPATFGLAYGLALSPPFRPSRGGEL